MKERCEKMNVTSNLKSITGNPKKAINKLAFPMILSMLLMSLNNVVDSIWVSGLGAGPLAAVGFVSPIFMILVGFGNGIGAGANSLISRFIGAKNYKEANNTVIHTIILSIILSIAFPVILLIFLEQILLAMGAGEVLGYAMEYGVIILIGTFSQLCPAIFGSIFRAEGAVKKATYPLALTAVLNIILDPIFIYTFNLGVGGAAIATVLSSTVALLLLVYWLVIKKDTFFSVTRENYKQKFSIYREILSVGVPASIEQLILSIVSIVNNYLITITAGTLAVAAFTATWRLISIGIMPAAGVGTAAITVAGIAYGARNYDNLKTVIKYSAMLALAMSVIVCVIFYVFAGPISFIFSYSSTSSDLSPLITDTLRILCIFLLAIPFGTAASSVFQGLGKGTFSLILTAIREFLLVIVFAVAFIFLFNMGEHGVYWGINLGAIIGSLAGFICIILYVNKLKKNSVKHD